jgi:hypothetical protein
MNRLHQLNQDNLVATNKEYQNRTYNDFSSEFQKVHPSAVRAFQLIALMYNRLTLVEKLDHNSQLQKYTVIINILPALVRETYAEICLQITPQFQGELGHHDLNLILMKLMSNQN